MDYRKNILPIGSYNYYEGCGFFVGNYFITCAHVIKNADRPYIYIEAKRIPLDNPVFVEYSKETSGYDLAVFHFLDINSELQISDQMIQDGVMVHSVSFKNLGEELVECEVRIGPDKEANYISGISSLPLKGGCSGSPILIGRSVVGMITGGNNNGDGTPCNSALPLNLCIFLSSAAISGVIKSICDKR